MKLQQYKRVSPRRDRGLSSWPMRPIAEVTCYLCTKKGHYSSDYPKRKSKEIKVIKHEPEAKPE